MIYACYRGNSNIRHRYEAGLFELGQVQILEKGQYQFYFIRGNTVMIGENTVTKYSHSSVPLQMLIYFSYHYTPFFFFINLCLYTYKGGISCRSIRQYYIA